MPTMWIFSLVDMKRSFRTGSVRSLEATRWGPHTECADYFSHIVCGLFFIVKGGERRVNVRRMSIAHGHTAVSCVEEADQPVGGIVRGGGGAGRGAGGRPMKARSAGRQEAAERGDGASRGLKALEAEAEGPQQAG